ncbi:MAG: hypothetical protein ACUVX8_14000 [Candidatus Zipacnadales bacterium]
MLQGWIMVALSVAPVWGQSPFSTDEIICPRVAKAPHLDGVLDDVAWATAAKLTAFTQPLSEAAPDKAVTAYICFTDEGLWLAFQCAEPRPDQLKTDAQHGSRDVWPDDCVEVWIRTTDNLSELSQFIINAAGVTQTVLRHPLDTEPTAKWEAVARVGDKSWYAELALPFASLGDVVPERGTMLQIKLGRQDHASGGTRLATWPPKSRYGGAEDLGRLYLESVNLLINPDLSQHQNGQPVGWGFGEGDRTLFASVVDAGSRVIRFETPGRYSVMQQSLHLSPNATYRLRARVRGTAAVYLRARTSKQAGEPSTPYTATSRPRDDYQPVEVTFPTGETGEALIIVGNTEDLGRGEVFISDLQVSRAVTYEAEGPAIPLAPGKPQVVKKLLMTDCRALRGFVAAPVDGRLDSYNWNMEVWEYNMRGAGAGVGYRYRDNDGLHITLADETGIDAVIIRQGARVKLYQGTDRYDNPGGAPLIWEFPGRARTSRALFPARVPGDRFSFFELEEGRIADCSFLRLESNLPRQAHPLPPAEDPVNTEALTEALKRRFGQADRIIYGLRHEDTPIKVPAKRAIHLLSGPLDDTLALTGVTLHLHVPDAPRGCVLTIAIQDPLNPRQELMGVDFALEEPGELQPILDFPDQIVPPGRRFWLTLTSEAPITLERVAIDAHQVAREQALPEALTFRKFVMKGLFCELSEARQWGLIRKDTNLDQFRKENHWGEGVVELVETIAHCKELGPKDDTVRQYDEWFWRSARELPPWEPRIDKVPGAPEWAIVARQAWLTVRNVAKWWLDNRLVPTGELGGLVGDDSDMYQNWADLPMFERDAVAAQILEAATNLAELAEAENLEAGLNRRTMDPLHAYEEGVNHEALMLWWFYGDPVYFERCLVAAKSMSALTTVTPKSHRHFKNQNCGAEDLRIDRELGVDGGAHPLMLHPCFEVAWYNRNPSLVRFLREWGDGWLEHQKPGEYATAVEVKSEQVTEQGTRPLYGGYGGQASAHNFLYWITDDLKYIQPFMDFFVQGRDEWPSRRFVPELWHRGALDGVERRESVLAGNPVTKATALGEKRELIEALKADIAELQRFPAMYTTAEVFTDRVFLEDVLSNATLCYTGGYATRNKYNHTHAVSWEGFGTDYAALVLTARRDRLKVLIHNFRGRPNEGLMRSWTLDHGQYVLTLGPDTDSDDQADRVERREEMEIARATAIPVRLLPQATVVLELTQLTPLDDLLQRPDLAICTRELELREGILSGVVHNIGAAEAPPFVIALSDGTGKVVNTQQLGPLPAPLDLQPKRIAFRFENIGALAKDWRVIIDPDDQIDEIYEGNNACGSSSPGSY